MVSRKNYYKFISSLFLHVQETMEGSKALLQEMQKNGASGSAAEVPKTFGDIYVQCPFSNKITSCRR